MEALVHRRYRAGGRHLSASAQSRVCQDTGWTASQLRRDDGLCLSPCYKRTTNMSAIVHEKSRADV